MSGETAGQGCGLRDSWQVHVYIHILASASRVVENVPKADTVSSQLKEVHSLMHAPCCCVGCLCML